MAENDLQMMLLFATIASFNAVNQYMLFRIRNILYIPRGLDESIFFQFYLFHKIKMIKKKPYILGIS